ncbi:unnamed protein product [Acanthoscelides obtectus]|uniref:Cyclic nucleotide-binding domain-containing protein n=1 Tax=Acanthoscelides obtectus TaxID=200917 RepID=A0A9P0JZM6_ACAOB|nr:unnamed protein product [Acanthoscelides obtectus]CAK1631649.1 hypothetical protein AOBTE_LOCUS7071 [Acanthoscelides obtectus]
MRRSTVLSSIARPSIYTVGTRNSISSFASPTHQSNCLHRTSDDQSTGIEKFTKWAKKLHTISADNPLTNKYFRSESAVNHELERHSELGYWYIVHPLSKLRNYVGSIFFICDVLSSIPVLPTLYLCEAIWGTRFLVGVGFLFIFCQLRLIRIASVVRIINQLAVYFQVTSKGRVFLLICMTVFLLTVHNFALLQLLIPKLVRKYFSKLKNEHRIWYVKYNLHEKPFAHIYTHCVLKSTAFMLAIRVDFYRMENQEEDYLLAIATYVVGKVIVCATYGRLKRDINLHQCKSLIQNVSLFSHLTAEEVSNVIEALKPEIFLPKDTVMLAGTYGDRMFFISSGTVAVYTHSGREVTSIDNF